MTRRRVRFTATARDHVRLLNRWWQENSVRPEILHDDLEEAVKMISALPGIGSPYTSAPVLGVRRFYLERLVSHLYYTSDEHEVVIRALWHARRGTEEVEIHREGERISLKLVEIEEWPESFWRAFEGMPEDFERPTQHLHARQDAVFGPMDALSFEASDALGHDSTSDSSSGSSK